MKLYVYDHCPFCVRARMAAGLKRLPCECVILPNDDERSPLQMIGQKMLPILQDDNGVCMGESLDIVHRLDAMTDRPMFDALPDNALREWLEKWDATINALVIPRTPDPVYAEFRSASARAYFTAKKEARFGSFAGLIARTDEFMAQLVQGFAELEVLLPDPDADGITHILLFPVLRSLTVMPGRVFPATIQTYLECLGARSGIPLVGTLRAQGRRQ